MKVIEEDTPPSSIQGDEISGIEAEEFFYIGDADEVLGEEEEVEEGDDVYYSLPPKDDSLLVFDKHIGSVFCCDIHPTGKLAVTGGEDDMAYVWNVENGEVVMECKGHKDSVIFAGFSFDGAFLATADMGGMIKVWKCRLEASADRVWPLEWEYEAGDLTWGLWHYGARVLICGAVAGEMYVFKIPSGDTKVLQGHNSKVECAKMFPDGRRIVAGYEDGSLKVWDLRTETVIHHIQTEAHLTGVTALDTHPDNNIIISVSSDGKVLLTTASTGKIVGQMDADNDLETVAFAKEPELGYFALGTLDGKVSIWDLSRQMVRHTCSESTDNDSAGVTKLFWVRDKLFTARLDGSVRTYEGRSGQPAGALSGHRSEVLDFCYNPQQELILTTSDDGTARIFKYIESKKE